jgi:anti-sigma regulatory factor (Ser/Thr protein kinase)/GNAT superfamily N-acetyltransferase
MTKESDTSRCSLTLPNELAYLPALLAFQRAIAQKCGFDQHDQRSMELALEEAITWVIHNAFPDGEQATFEVAFREVGNGLEVSIIDQGLPWDPRLLEAYHPDADLDTQTGDGLSGYLLQQLMDRFEFINRGRDGKITRFTKYLPGKPVGDGVHVAACDVPDEPPGDRPALKFELRLALPEESIEIARAVYDCYGYSYASEYVYYPERIAAMNQDGALCSAVAIVSGNGEVGGHFALIFREALPPELGLAVTKQKYRGYGFARGLGEYLEQEAKQRGYKGVQIKEVTSHPYTQKFSAKLGFVDIGFLLAHSPKSLSFKGIQPKMQQRNSDVMGFKYLEPPEPRSVYLPAQHRQMLQSIYDELGVPVEEALTSVDLNVKSQTLLSVAIDKGRSLCEIHVTQYGQDFTQVLKRELRRVRLSETQVVEMYLGLNDPAVEHCTQEAETLGFFFTGLLPETGQGDALVMQYMNGIQIEYNKLVIERAATRELLDYVARQDPMNS